MAQTRIGWVSLADPGYTLREFREGLRRLGYDGAKALSIEVRLIERSPEAARAALAELQQLQVRLVVTQAAAAPLVHRAAAGRIPVVFAFSGDPVEAGLVKSLSSPGGNTTGVSFLSLELVGKRLELLKELAPRMQRIAILANPQHPGEKSELRESLAGAQRLGLRTTYLQIDPRAPDLEAAFQSMRRDGAEGVVVFPDAGMLALAPRIAALAQRERMLSVSGWADFARAGNVGSYGPSLAEGYRRLAYYVDRVLAGVHPSSLPVELPTRIELVVNVKAAKALGLAPSPSLLLRADELIE